VIDSDILLAGLSAAGILFLYLLYSVTSRRKKNRKSSKTVLPAAASGQESMANLTRVLPVGMLIAKSGSNRGLVYAIDPTGIKIGRDREKNQIIIDDPVISREHAWIGLSEGKIVVRDINSSNGTYINSLDSPRISLHELRDGDIIFIGKTGVESFKFKAA
jgi:hypothetical protein